MLTAKGQQSDKEKGLALGADDYFVKPFSPMELMNKIDKILA
jgi:DNA-binding response OmpR family regulator